MSAFLLIFLIKLVLSRTEFYKTSFSDMPLTHCIPNCKTHDRIGNFRQAVRSLYDQLTKTSLIKIGKNRFSKKFIVEHMDVRNIFGLFHAIKTSSNAFSYRSLLHI